MKQKIIKFLWIFCLCRFAGRSRRRLPSGRRASPPCRETHQPSSSAGGDCAKRVLPLARICIPPDTQTPPPSRTARAMASTCSSVSREAPADRAAAISARESKGEGSSRRARRSQPPPRRAASRAACACSVRSASSSERRRAARSMESSRAGFSVRSTGTAPCRTLLRAYASNRSKHPAQREGHNRHNTPPPPRA